MGLVSPTIPFLLKAAASARQVLRVLEEPVQQEKSRDRILTLNRGKLIGNLSLKEVTFCYPERPTTTVLDCLSLEIPANKTEAKSK